MLSQVNNVLIVEIILPKNILLAHPPLYSLVYSYIVDSLLKGKASIPYILNNESKCIYEQKIYSVSLISKIRYSPFFNNVPDIQQHSSSCVIKFLGHVIRINCSHVTRFEKSQLPRKQQQDTLFTIKWWLYTLTNNSGRYWCWKFPRLFLLWLVSEAC